MTVRQRAIEEVARAINLDPARYDSRNGWGRVTGPDPDQVDGAILRVAEDTLDAEVRRYLESLSDLGVAQVRNAAWQQARKLRRLGE